MEKAKTSERIKEVMKERKLRQVDILTLAEPFCNQYGIKLGKSALSQYISGKFIPEQDKLFVLALALNVDEAWLMGFDVPKERTAYDYNNDTTIIMDEPINLTELAKMNIIKLSDLEMEFVRLLRSMSEENRQALLSLLRRQ